MTTITKNKEYQKYWVAKNMICISDKSSKTNEDEVNDFIKKHKDIIQNVVENMPRGMTTIGAAVGKCAIKYGPEKAFEFLRNSKDAIFNGKEDPVYHFYLWLHGLKGPKRKKHDISTYEVALYACKQYCMGKKIKRLNRAKDFEWISKWKIA